MDTVGGGGMELGGETLDNEALNVVVVDGDWTGGVDLVATGANNVGGETSVLAVNETVGGDWKFTGDNLAGNGFGGETKLADIVAGGGALVVLLLSWSKNELALTANWAVENDSLGDFLCCSKLVELSVGGGGCVTFDISVDGVREWTIGWKWFELGGSTVNGFTLVMFVFKLNASLIRLFVFDAICKMRKIYLFINLKIIKKLNKFK